MSASVSLNATLKSATWVTLRCFLRRWGMDISLDKIYMWLVRYHFSRARVTITDSIVTSSPALHNQLWRHPQNADGPSEVRCRCVEIVFAIVIYELITSCKKEHDDVIKWKQFPRYWPFVRKIHLSPVNSPHKGQWRRALMFSLIYARLNSWVNNREVGDFRRHPTHCEVIVMEWCMYCQDELIMRSRECCIGVYFPSCEATREINTNIIL